MTELTLEGFAAFVREQDAEKIEGSLYWHDSPFAVYMSSKGHDPSEASDTAYLILGDFAETMGNSTYKTYGQLQTALEEAGL